MSVVAQPPAWPVDRDHRDAIDTLLVMAEAESRWGENRRAVALLDHAERIVGSLPHSHEHLRRRCRALANSRPKR